MSDSLFLSPTDLTALAGYVTDFMWSGFGVCSFAWVFGAVVSFVSTFVKGGV